MINKKKYRAALAERGLTQGRLAIRLEIAPSTLSSWVNDLATAPTGWVARVERVLRVSEGSLVR